MLEWTWALTAASLIGVIANIKKRRECFYIWAATNSLWMVVDFSAGLYSQSALFGVYVILAFWGIYEWKETKEKSIEVPIDFPTIERAGRKI